MQYTDFQNIAKPDTLKFNSGVEKLNWEKVAFKPFSVEECKARWYELGKPVSFLLVKIYLIA